MKFILTQFLTFIVSLNCIGQPCSPAKVELKDAIITADKSNKSNTSFKLFDEQVLAGDPENKNGGVPKTMWFPGWEKKDYPARVVLNLQDPVKISTIFLRDVENKGLFVVEAGMPGKWEVIISDSLKNYQRWNKHSIDVTTQYLRFTRTSASANVAEVVLYGCLLPDGGRPDPILDVRATLITDNSIKIIWTATGDDGKIGSAKKYDIRYSKTPIKNFEDFNRSQKVSNEIIPTYSGIIQSYLVQNLESNTQYYFAIRAIDNAGQASEISNNTQAITLSPQENKLITIDKFIGANAFVDDPIDKMMAVGFIREYHNWRWDEGGAKAYKGYPNNAMEFSPSSAGEGSWDFDEFYTKIKNAGLEISPVIQGTPNWLQGNSTFPFDNKPLDEVGAIDTEPNSYKAKAHHSYQFAARYGATPVNEKELTLELTQPKRTGLNLIQYMEDWNEPNKNWAGKDAEFLPEEYAAMASANYDGHMNTMGNGQAFGLKNADPKMNFVMGGIFSLDISWIEKIQSWFENNRPDNKFIPDVINVHHYSWKSGKGWQGGGPAKSPEEDNFKERLKAIVDYRNNHLPNVEVWISEFGWDTNPGSPLAPSKIGSYDLQEVQGQWLVRAYLAFAAARVDRAQMYMLRDVNPASGRWFNSCGLTGPKGDWTPKKSWYYVYTLKNTLKNMVFVGEEKSSNQDVLIYKFKNVQNQKGAYVVWCKTSTQHVVKDFKLPLPGQNKTAQLVEMEVGKVAGITTTLPVQNNSVTVSVSERPVFVLVDNVF